MYRFRALAKQRDPDELDSPVVLASSRGWVAVFVSLFVVVAAISWSIVGKIPVSTLAHGSIVNAGGTITVSSMLAGSVSNVMVNPGDIVRTDQTLITVNSADGSSHKLPAPAQGRVASISVPQGGYVTPGTPVGVIEKDWDDHQPLVAQVLVSAQSIGQIHPGNPVLLRVSGVNSRQYGMLKGTVREVAPFPVSQAKPGQEPPGTLVTIELTRNTATVSGYEWTSVAGPPQELHTQTGIEAEIQTGNVALISLLVRG